MVLQFGRQLPHGCATVPKRQSEHSRCLGLLDEFTAGLRYFVFKPVTEFGVVTNCSHRRMSPEMTRYRNLGAPVWPGGGERWAAFCHLLSAQARFASELLQVSNYYHQEIQCLSPTLCSSPKNISSLSCLPHPTVSKPLPHLEDLKFGEERETAIPMRSLGQYPGGLTFSSRSSFAFNSARRAFALRTAARNSLTFSFSFWITSL